MKASDYIASFLKERHVTTVFEMTGGMITFLLDSIHKAGGVRIMSVHHEQAASFAADAFGRMTGIPGVAFATSGPGATNLLTGIGSCYFDSSPAVFITGQVNRHEQKGDRAIRQLGFQETDIVSMARPVTKDAFQIDDPARLPELLHYAFELAVSGRPGPVLIDIPMDVQRAEVTPPSAAEIQGWREKATAKPASISAKSIDDLFDGLSRAKRPLVLAGGGIRSGRSVDLLRKFVHTIKVPVVNSLMGVDALPAGDLLRVGLIGSYGNRWANHALGASDFLLVLGSRLDVRQTGSETDAFKAGRTIFHVDCEPGEVNNRIEGCYAMIGELREFLTLAIDAAAGRTFADHCAWSGQISDLRNQWPDTKELADVAGINPNALMHALSEKSRAASAYVIDVGQHQMWAAQSIDPGPDQRFLTSGGMGSMGFALPAALGAAAAGDGRPVVVVAGDGGFQTNIQELQTVLRNKLPIKIVIVNNQCHGMVRQFQQSYFSERYQSTLWGYSAPDFAKVAHGYGIASRTVESVDDVDAALDWLWQNPREPALLQVMIDTFANAYPKLAFGLPLTEMEPLAKPLEMEGT
jgi:acetolactate synthase-1/2/3 large subunit